MYKKLLEGHISFGGIQDALEAVSRLRDIKNGVLQIISQDSSGLIGIFCGRFITGAVLTLSGESGNRALRRLLASKEGKFTFLDAGDDVLPDLKQSLGIDIDLLLATGLRPDALPTEEALSGLMVSGDNIKTIDTDAVITPAHDEDRLHRIQRTYDRLLSLSAQQAMSFNSLEDQVLAQAVPHATTGLDEIPVQRRTIPELSSLTAPPTSAPQEPAPPAEKPPIPPWDEPWEPPSVAVEAAQPTEFKRIKKWDQNSRAYHSVSVFMFFFVVALALFYLLPYIVSFLSHF